VGIIKKWQKLQLSRDRKKNRNSALGLLEDVSSAAAGELIWAISDFAEFVFESSPMKDGFPA